VCIFPEENPVEWNTLDREETLQVDALGNETTPFITDQEAYYARKMDTYVYDIHAASTRSAYLYCWNPRYGSKGPNNVISLFHHHAMTNPCGAKKLNVWADRCGAQANNWACVFYSLYTTDPAMGCLQYAEKNEKYLVSNHSYNACDRDAGIISMAQRHDAQPKEIMDDWMDLMCEANKVNPNRVYMFQQSAHRLWVKRNATGADKTPGFLDQFYRKPNKKTASHWGTRAGKRVHVLLHQYRWRNYGGGFDDDGDYKLHPGVVWLRKGVTEAGPDGNIEPWTKLDLRKTIPQTKGGGFVTIESEGVKTDILDPHFDLYDGLIKQPEAKDHDTWRLSFHFPCRCSIHGECDEKKGNVLPCVYFAQPHLYPPVPKERQKAIDKARLQEEQGMASSDEDSDDADDLDSEEEDNQPLHAVFPQAQLSAAMQAQVRNDIAAMQSIDGAFSNVAIKAVGLEGEAAGLHGPEPEAASDSVSRGMYI
jgi:hypothetical protein